MNERSNTEISGHLHYYPRLLINQKIERGANEPLDYIIYLFTIKRVS